MLEAFDIKYLSHTIEKGQILANLVTEFTEGREKDGTEEGGTPDKGILTIMMTTRSLLWELYVDGATN